FLGPVFDMQNTVYGVWSGLSLHEIAQVVLAGGAGGDDGMAMALLSKLSRVFLLIPVSFIIMYFVAKKQHSKTEEKVDIPYFLILVAILNSFVAIPIGLRDFIDQFTSLLMVMAMVGLGLSVSLRSIREKAMKPLLALIILSVVISLVSLYAASFF